MAEFLALATLAPAWVPLLDRLSRSVAAPLDAPALGALVALFLGGLALAALSQAPLPTLSGRAALLGGLLIPAVVGSLIPAAGSVTSGLLGLGALGLAALLNRRDSPVGTPEPDDAPPTVVGVGAGLALSGLGLAHLTAVPYLSPDPFVLAALVGAGLAGLGVGHAMPRRPILGLGLAAFGLALSAELPPRAVSIALDLLATRGGEAPGIGYGLPLVLAALLGAVTGLGAGLSGGRGVPLALGAAGGLVLWQLGPGVLAPDVLLHGLAALTALLVAPLALRAGSAGGRLAGIALPLLAAAAALLPAPGAGSLPDGSGWTALGNQRELELARRRAEGTTAVQRSDRFGISRLALRSGTPVTWTRGGTIESLDAASVHSDRFFGYLPSLLAEQPNRRVLIFGLGTGSTVDAARRSTAGLVQVVEPSRAAESAIRAGIDLGPILGDPAVQVRRTDPLAAGDGDWDAVLVDLAEPWRPGALAPLSRARLEQLRDGLADDGIAVLRVPLASVSPTELADIGRRIGEVFPALVAWLDPVEARNLVITAWATPRRPRASTIQAALRRDGVREALGAAGLTSTADVLERAVTDRQGLTLVDAGGARDAAGVAVVAAARRRRGRRTLPLAALAAAGRTTESLVDLDGLDPELQEELSERLAGSEETRRSYLSLLGFLAEGKSKEAIALATQISRDSANPARDLRALVAPWLRRGRGLRQAGRLDQSRAELATAFAFSPQDVDVNLELARVLLELGELEEAVGHVQRARDADPTSVEPVLLLADIRMRRGLLAEAAQALSDAEPLHPGDVRLLTNLGYLLTQIAVGSDETVQKRLGRARVLFQRASSLSPRAPQPRAGLAEVYYRQGEFELALDAIDRALLLEPSCRYQSWRGHVLAALGRLDEAEASLQSAVMACPELVEAIVMQGAVAADRGRPADAREAWERVLTLDPANVAAKENLARLEESKLEDFVEQMRPRTPQ